MRILKTFSLFWRIIAGSLMVLMLSFSQEEKVFAVGATYTVCPLGCDFTTLTDAVIFPGLSQDTVVLTDDFMFDPVNESTSISVPSVVTIQCEANADFFGDAAELAVNIFPDSDFVLEDCKLENVNFDATGDTNVKFLNNIFSGAAPSQLVFTSTQNFEVSGNEGIQHVQIQSSDDGLISENAFECIFSSCITVTTAGGGPFDFSDPADVPNDIDITDNVITNQQIATGGDFVFFYAGLNINYSGNTLTSVPVNDSFVTMLTLQNADVEMLNNYFIFPEKAPGSNNGTWGINIRVSESDANLLAENNTLIMGGAVSTLNGNSCFGVFDDGSQPGVKNINVDFNYNHQKRQAINQIKPQQHDFLF